jgi:hypothetical protein
MNEYYINQLFLELHYHQTHHTDLIRQSRNTYLLLNIRTPYPSLWDTTLYRIGNFLVFLGERMRRNRSYVKLSKECQC